MRTTHYIVEYNILSLANYTYINFYFFYEFVKNYVNKEKETVCINFKNSLKFFFTKVRFALPCKDDDDPPQQIENII